MKTRLWVLGLMLSCTEYSYSSKKQKDVFQQVRRNTVDILMVVDNSCSMVEEQEKLGSNFDSFISAFQGVDVDWQLAVVTTDMLQDHYRGRMIGAEDELELLTSAGRSIDRVSWDRDWDLDIGTSWQLDPSAYSMSDNDSLESWCLSTASYGDGDKGSPGSINEGCGLGDPESPEEGVDEGPREPTSGDIIFTEIMADPEAVADELGEWVELTSMSADTLDLSGGMLVDDGRNLYTIPEGTLVAPGQTLVIARSADQAENGGVPAGLASGEGMTLNNKVVVLTGSTDGAKEIFAEMVAVGINGSGIETGLDAAMAALSPELLGTDNAGFLREEANLSLIFVSDENDYSEYAVNDYLNFFQALKGEEAYRDHSRMNISAVVGKDSPAYEGQPSCESSNGVADYGVRYVDLASRTEGVLESICDEDFSPVAAELGLLASGLQVTFALSELPDLSTLVVKHYETNEEKSLIGELERDVEYRYDGELNALVFDPAQVPPSETWLVAEYEVLAKGQTNDGASE